MSAEHMRISNAAYWLGYLQAELHPAYGESDPAVVDAALGMVKEALYGPDGASSQFPTSLPEAVTQ